MCPAFGAVLDRRPRWVPRSEASTFSRARRPGARTRLPSLRRTTDPPSRFLPSQAHADPNGADYAVAGRNSVWWRMTAHRPQSGRSVSSERPAAAGRGAMRASLLANATAATSRGRRASSAFSQGLASTALGQRSTAWAPVISSRRSSISPRLLIRPSRVLPPLEFWRGTRPSHRCQRHRSGPAEIGAAPQRRRGRELAAAAEGRRVGDRRRQGAGRDGPNPWNGRQPPAGRVGAVSGQQGAPERCQPFRQRLQLLDQQEQDRARRLGYAGRACVADHGRQLRHVARALGCDDAELGQMPAQGVDQPCRASTSGPARCANGRSALPIVVRCRCSRSRTRAGPAPPAAARP